MATLSINLGVVNSKSSSLGERKAFLSSFGDNEQIPTRSKLQKIALRCRQDFCALQTRIILTECCAPDKIFFLTES